MVSQPMPSVSGFTGSTGRNRTISDGQRTLVNAIDLYVSPYGEYRVILNTRSHTRFPH